MWACSPKILLVNTLPWCQELCERMQCMLGLKSSRTQALWWLTILANFYPPLERFINGFCHWSTNFDGLKRGQLWLNLCHRQLAHKDGLLRASQSNYWQPKPCWGHYWRTSKASWPSGLNDHRLRVAFYLKVLVIAMLFCKHQAEAIHCLLLTDRRPDWEAE